MIAHSKIKNLDDAIASCTNYVETYGVLSELNIDIIEQGEKIVVKYKGVVDINNAFIKIYGSTNNNSLSFATTINTLKSLEAEIITMSNNGEVVDTKYFRFCVDRVKTLEAEGKFRRHPIAWELWSVIKTTPINEINYSNYTVINDYTCDVDKVSDIDFFRGAV